MEHFVIVFERDKIEFTLPGGGGTNPGNLVVHFGAPGLISGAIKVLKK
mgnify:CR=1 FL=1